MIEITEVRPCVATLAPRRDAGSRRECRRQRWEERLVLILTAMRSNSQRVPGESWQRCMEQRASIDEHLQGGRLSKIRLLLARRGVEVATATLYRLATDELAVAARPAGYAKPGPRASGSSHWTSTRDYWHSRSLPPGSSVRRLRSQAARLFSGLS
jgi:hypothetical protein